MRVLQGNINAYMNKLQVNDAVLMHKIQSDLKHRNKDRSNYVAFIESTNRLQKMENVIIPLIKRSYSICLSECLFLGFGQAVHNNII